MHPFALVLSLKLGNPPLQFKFNLFTNSLGRCNLIMNPMINSTDSSEIFFVATSLSSTVLCLPTSRYFQWKKFYGKFNIRFPPILLSHLLIALTKIPLVEYNSPFFTQLLKLFFLILWTHLWILVILPQLLLNIASMFTIFPRSDLKGIAYPGPQNTPYLHWTNGGPLNI